MLDWRNGASRVAMCMVVAALAAPMAAEAADVVASGTTGQALATGNTYIVVRGSTLSNTGAAAMTASGPSALPGIVVNNFGTISGNDRGINISGGVAGDRNLTLNNMAGAVISTADDAFRINAAIGNGTVTVNNDGSMVAATGQVLDLASNTSSTGRVVINNSATGIMRANGNDAVRLGSGSSIVTNSGLIDSTASTNRGVTLDITDLSTVSAYQIINRAGGVIQAQDDTLRVTAVSGSRTTTGSFLVDNAGTISSTNGGQAIDFADIGATSGTMIINRAGGLIVAATNDAIRTGQNATVTNYGTIMSNGVGSFDAVNVQNNTAVVNNMATGIISGTRHGINIGMTGSVIVTNEAGGQIIGRNGSGVGSDNIAVVVNYGRITGAYNGSGTGDGDGVDVDNAATITNYGLIEGTGAGGADARFRFNNSEGISIGGGTIDNYGRISGASYGIVVNNDSVVSRSGVAATTITNQVGGTIIGQSGYAIRLENKLGTAADNDTIVNRGTIIGNGTIPDPTAIVNLSTGPVDTNSVGTLDGVVYTGTGSARFIRGDGSAIQMGEGNDVLTNYGSIIGNTGRAVNLEGGNDTANIMKGSRIVGLVDGGAGTDTLNYNKVGLTEAKRIALQGGQTVNIGGTLYTSFEVVTGAAQSYASFATANTFGIANVFDNLSNTVGASAAAVGLLDAVASTNDVGAALSQLTPAAFQGLGRMAMDTSFQTSSLVGQRMTQNRMGGVGNDLAGVSNAMAMADSGMFDRNSSVFDRSLASLSSLPIQSLAPFGDAGADGSTADAMAYAPVTKALPGMRPVALEAERGLFVTSGGSFAREGARANAPATRSNTVNVVAGADWRLNDHVTAGVFGGYALTRGELDEIGSHTKISTKTIGGYGAYQAPGWFATAMGLYGWSDYDTTRMAVGTSNVSAFSGTHYALRGTVGTDLRVSGWVVTPEIGLQYTRVMTGGFTETGIAALNVAADHSESLRSSVGARFAYDTTLNGSVITPELRLAWLHEFGDGVRSINASFADTTLPGSFITATGSALRDRGVIGAGVSGKLAPLTVLSVNYDAIVGSNDSVAHQVMGRIRHSF